MKRNKIVAIAASTAMLVAGIATTARFKTSFTTASECNHIGNHYAAKAATCVEAGNKEFWACCVCHNQFLAQPANGTWTDLPELSSPLAPDHIAYEAVTEHHHAPSTNVIGYYECPTCGDLDARVMTTEDLPAFTTGYYGSSCSRLASTTVEGDNITGNNSFVKNGALTFGANTGKDVVLPKVNYSLYENVTFNLAIDHFNNDSLSVVMRIGDQELANWALLKGNYQSTLIVHNLGDSLKVEIQRKGAFGQSNSITITDENVMNGTTGLTLNCTSNSRTIYLNDIILTEASRVKGEDMVRGGKTATNYTSFETYTGTVGGVSGKFAAATLAESTSGTYAAAHFEFDDVAYTETTSAVEIRLYIDCASTTETTTSFILRDYVDTPYSADNPNWTVLNKSLKNNQWYSIVVPTERLAHDGVIDNIHFYGNSAKAGRTYYVEYFRFSRLGANSVKMLKNETFAYSSQNTCTNGTSNLGNSFEYCTNVAAEDSFGYGEPVTKLNVKSTTYVLDRFDFYNPLMVRAYSKITLRLYVKTSSTNAFKMIMCPNAGTSGSNQQVIAVENFNKWIDVTFTNAQSMATDGYISNLNFGVWEVAVSGTTALSADDAIYVASVSLS